MNILPGIKIVDLALHLEKENVLVIADTHIGYEEALNKSGFLIPKLQFEQLGKRIEKILKQVASRTNKLRQVIINGDVKHEFGEISDQEWRDALKLFDVLSLYCDEIVLVRGNHDNILEPIAKKRNVRVVDYEIIDDIMIIHGDKPIPSIPSAVKTIIIGHEHPAVSFKQRPSDKFKCFLKGKYKGKNLVVMPSFLSVPYGTNIVSDAPWSPILKETGLSEFEIFVADETEGILYFGKLKDFDK